MVNPAQDWPDFTRAMLLVGVDAAGDPVGVLVDSEGNLQALLKGETALGALKAVRVDDDGQMIMIPRGATGNYLNVDAEGFLTAVLKGSLAGDLHTISVDVNGRIEAFILDAVNQWGSVVKVGSGELAGRLGSPVTFDWRGQVLWLTSFGDGVGTVKTMSDGTGAGVSIDPEYSLTEGFSLKLLAGSDDDRYAMAYGYTGLPLASRIGISIAIAGLAERTSIALRARSGATRWMGTIHYTWATGKIEYQLPTGLYETLSFKPMYGSASVFNRLKLSIDVGTQKYIRFMINHTQYNLSAEDLYSDAGGFDGTMEFEIETLGRAAVNDYQLLDHIILTVNEP